MSTANTPGASRRRLGRAVVGGVALVVVAVFVGLAVARNWDAVRDDLGRLSAVDWVSAIVFGAAGIVGSWAIWSTVLTGMGSHIDGHDSRALFFAGQLGKYVPGSVWPAVIQAHLGRRHGVRPRTMVASYVYALAISVGAGGAVGLLALAASRPRSELWVALVLGAVSIAGLLALLHPSGAVALIERLARRLGRDVVIVQPDRRRKSMVLVLCFANWLVFGLHAWAIARPLGADAGDIPVVVGGFALAFVAGIVFLPVPGGAGIREGLLVLTIGTLLGRPGALTLALVSRLVLLVLDVVVAAAAGAIPLIRAARRWQAEDATDLAQLDEVGASATSPVTPVPPGEVPS